MSVQTPVSPSSAPSRSSSSAAAPRIYVPADRKAMPAGLKLGLGVVALAVISTVGVLLYKSGAKAGGTSGAPTDPLGNIPATGSPVTNPSTPAPGTLGATGPGANTANNPNPANPAAPGTSGAAGANTAAATPSPAPVSFEMGKPPTKPLVPPPAPSNDQAAPRPNNPANENPQAPGANPPGVTPGGTPTGTPGTPGSGAPAEPLSKDGSSTLSPRPETVVSEAQRLVSEAQRDQAAGNTVEARAKLNRALLDSRLPANERGALRQQLAALNETILFSPELAKGDPTCDLYTVVSGDNLVNIRTKLSLPVDWRLLQRLNKTNPSALRIGQKLKVVRVPFHAVVHKSEFRLDLYMGDPTSTGAPIGPDGQDLNWIYVRSFPVGLGEIGAGSAGTPEGTYTVRPKSKLVNPHWVNPRTGEKFSADDPKNPIGEHWIGLDGSDAAGKPILGIGIHGTIDPDSIGKQKSMGCVRMRSDDVAMMYEVLVEKLSTVRIMR